ncbi:flagellar assembly protein FliX [Roseococcus sp. YIM B11640]|uniref:flagellar assembly protein FliX n=1 Tax=Roseococcus sp. YIM B11640 TaxID=3133973 RepID=UPI003C7E67C0
MLTPIKPGALGSPAGGARRAAGATGFRLPTGQGEGRAESAGAAEAAGLSGALLGLQSGWTDAERDDAARRRGNAALEELSALQLALLSGRADPARLRRLAQLAEGEAGADPSLREVLQAISLRARIELMRRRA